MMKWADIFVDDRISLVFDENEECRVKTRRLRDDVSMSRSPFERDYCRVVYSSHFRRLAGKTQIVPTSGIDHVRNRLTHSIEVSTIAGSIFRELEKRLISRMGVRIDRSEDAYWVVRTAGLAHDIGNPPFGHAGEQAIRKWGEDYFKHNPRYSDVARDFQLFDGNAQSFRLLSRNDFQLSSNISLTLTSLAAIVKYPYSVCDKRSDRVKFNAFKSEKGILDVVMDRHGLKEKNGYYRRHPLSFILEAADDIAYVLSDIEDARYAEIITSDKSARLFKELANSGNNCRDLKISHNALQSAVAAILIKDFAKAIYDSLDDICSNRRFTGHDIEDALSQSTREWLFEVKDFRKQIMHNDKVIKAECDGADRIHNVLNKLVRVIPFVCSKKKTTSQISKLIKYTFGGEFFEKNRVRTPEWWLHVILDYVSGMTDEYIGELDRCLQRLYI